MLLISGEYEVFTFIPQKNANAFYKIYHNDCKTKKIINQNNYSDE